MLQVDDAHSQQLRKWHKLTLRRQRSTLSSWMPNKTHFIDYVNALVESDCVLMKGGLILVDNNVLWKGVILDVARSGNNSGWYDELRQRRQ